MQGKVAIVTASSTGIGKAIVQKLAAAGCKVIVSSRNKEHIDKTVGQLRKKGYEATGVVCHVGKKQDRQNLIKITIDTYGRLDYLVPNAAVSTQMGNFIESEYQAVLKMWQINYHSVFLLIQLALPHLRKQKNSAIVNISSYVGYQLAPIIGHYSITKTALIALTKLLARELKDDNIRVNAIAPGMIKTDFSSILWKNRQQESIKIMHVNRLGLPEDIANSVKFLLSDQASYITGQCLGVAGRPISRL